MVLIMNTIQEFNRPDLFNLDKPKIHNLKINKKYFMDIYSGIKTFEIRYNDRNYQVGDIIQFSVINDAKEVFMQPVTKYIITYILDYPEALKPGYIILGIKSTTVD